jgi:hypothetical protein
VNVAFAGGRAFWPAAAAAAAAEVWLVVAWSMDPRYRHAGHATPWIALACGLAGWLVARPARLPALLLGSLEGVLVLLYLPAFAWAAFERWLGHEIFSPEFGGDPLGPPRPEALAVDVLVRVACLVLLVLGWRRFRREEAERAQAAQVATF